MKPLPSRQLQLLLLLIVSFNVIPHTFELPPWITTASITLLLWTGLHLFKNVPLPPAWLRSALVIAGTAGVFIEWHTIVGQEPATGLLVFLASLKMLEATRYRDAMLIIFTSYFLLMAHLLVSQSLGSTLYMGLDVLLITALMFQLHKRDRRTSVRSLRPAMRLLGLALPVWIFLFVLFPRFSTGFWRLHVPPPTQTGFSDEVSPGDVAQLIGSEEPAFRVTFTRGQPPSPEAMYWRGAILQTYEGGLRWSRNGAAPSPENRRIGHRSTGAPIVQEIVLEPTFRKWLFALDFPRDLSFEDPVKNSQVQRRPGMIYETTKDIGTRVLYEAYSIPESPPEELSRQDRNLYLQVPGDVDNTVRDLAMRLSRESDGTTKGKIERILNYFDEEKFRYTKEPGALPNDPLKEFLFNTKIGFCEHFAATFATLMRLMQIPSRVVVGFQGGIYNQFGSYLLVRNLDAHAWSEVWSDEESRWMRVDPTATIAPLRLRLGGDFNLMDPSELTSDLTPELLRSGLGRGWSARWMWRSRLAFDAAAMSWNNFLLKYDFQYQKELFAKFGLSEANRWIFFLWVAAGIGLFIFALQFALRIQSRREDPLLDGYHRFCARCEAAGAPRLPNEGPLEFSQRARIQFPQNDQEISSLAEEFIELRYGPTAQDASTLARRSKEFRKRARRFSILPRSPKSDPNRSP